jgi:magnesium chelatase family protein
MRECVCSPYSLERYQLRMSGPLLDRIDLQVYVLPVPIEQLRTEAPGESSSDIRARVAAARDRQRSRLRRWNLHCNAEMPSSVMRATCKLDSVGESTLADLVRRNGTFTARSIDRLIKVARTLADLLGQDAIDAGCLLEAAAYRDRDPAIGLDPLAAITA